MNITIVSVVCILLLMITICHFFLGRLSSKHQKKYEHLYRIEVTESYFAEARNELMKLALDKKIDVNSKAFKYLYHINTAFMRRPDQYNELSQMLAYEIFGKAQDNSKVDDSLFNKKDTTSWDIDTKRIFKMTADAIGHITIEYSPITRFLLRLLRFGNKNVTHSDVLNLLIKVSKDDKDKLKAESEFKKAQAQLYELSGNSSSNKLQLC